MINKTTDKWKRLPLLFRLNFVGSEIGWLDFSLVTKIGDHSLENPIVTRSLVSATTYSHPTKKSLKEDMQICRNTVPREQVGNCMSKKGWSIKVKRYNHSAN